jgi:hypothetical protein
MACIQFAGTGTFVSPRAVSHERTVRGTPARAGVEARTRGALRVPARPTDALHSPSGARALHEPARHRIHSVMEWLTHTWMAWLGTRHSTTGARRPGPGAEEAAGARVGQRGLRG